MPENLARAADNGLDGCDNSENDEYVGPPGGPTYEEQSVSGNLTQARGSTHANQPRGGCWLAPGANQHEERGVSGVLTQASDSHLHGCDVSKNDENDEYVGAPGAPTYEERSVSSYLTHARCSIHVLRRQVKIPPVLRWRDGRGWGMALSYSAASRSSRCTLAPPLLVTTSPPSIAHVQWPALPYHRY